MSSLCNRFFFIVLTRITCLLLNSFILINSFTFLVILLKFWLCLFYVIFMHIVFGLFVRGLFLTSIIVTLTLWRGWFNQGSYCYTYTHLAFLFVLVFNNNEFLPDMYTQFLCDYTPWWNINISTIALFLCCVVFSFYLNFKLLFLQWLEYKLQ